MNESHGYAPHGRTPPHQVAAIIPVRRGSVGFPNKNMRLIAGMPLLGYTINAAKEARRVSRVIVSADDETTVSYAREEGVEAVLHPPHLSTDDAPTVGVVIWNFRRIAASGSDLEMLVVLRATSPLRVAGDIDDAISLLSRNAQADSLVSVVMVPGVHPIRMKRILDDGRLVDAFESEGYSPRRRQTLEPLYVRNGAIYIAMPSVLERGHLWGNHCLAYPMPQERSVNINTAFDFAVAEFLIKQRVQVS